jgi:hypothetical protein
MGDKNLRQMRTGEVAEQARRAGVRDVEHMNKEQMVQAMSRAKPQQARAGGGGRKAQAPRPQGTGPQDWKNIPGNQS